MPDDARAIAADPADALAERSGRVSPRGPNDGEAVDARPDEQAAGRVAAADRGPGPRGRRPGGPGARGLPGPPGAGAGTKREAAPGPVPGRDEAGPDRGRARPPRRGRPRDPARPEIPGDPGHARSAASCRPRPLVVRHREGP